MRAHSRFPHAKAIAGSPSVWEGVWRATIDAKNTGAHILVPLTTSLYVPGTLADKEKVIVDVGTGFYVEKVNTPMT